MNSFTRIYFSSLLLSNSTTLAAFIATDSICQPQFQTVTTVTTANNNTNTSHSRTVTAKPSIQQTLQNYLKSDNSLYIYDLNSLVKSYKLWTKLLPKIKPFYAVKCNPDIEIIKRLASLGTNFDCASPVEIETVLSLGIDAANIIYANPCKTGSDIKYAAANNINITTFDSLAEIEKIAKYAPDTELVMRIYATDESAQCILSNKYGCFEEEWDGLLEKSKELGMKVVGISFHVGSGAMNPNAFTDALAKARKLYDLGKTYGYYMNFIDIGGGFSRNNILKMSRAINAAIGKYFGDNAEFKFIAEPGRYFAENVATFFAKIIGVRERRGMRDYYINDSTYGTFNCISYDHIKVPIPKYISSKITSKLTTKLTNNKEVEVDVEVATTIYGNTCDGGDIIAANIKLPRLEVNDWLIWNNFGAYTIAAACDFNGINLTKPNKIYY